MSEEEIIGKINWAIHVNEMTKSINGDNIHVNVNVLQGLLDLYNQEKEKNKELENCLQMAKQIMTADISEDFDCMKLKQFKKYLLNEIKLNENFEEQ